MTQYCDFLKPHPDCVLFSRRLLRVYYDDVYNISYNDCPGVKFSSQKSRYVRNAHVGEYANKTPNM